MPPWRPLFDSRSKRPAVSLAMAQEVRQRGTGSRFPVLFGGQLQRSRSRSSKGIVGAAFIFVLASLILYAGFQHSRSAGFTTASQDEPWRLDPYQHSSRSAKTLRYEWKITSGERRPDGVLKEVLLINDAFPGPTIEARSGDRIVIEVENGLVESNRSISIHWHGLEMQNANNMDGAAGLTQDAIMPGEAFTYDFVIADDQSGTFWYHAHSAVQRADGLFGGFVVHKPWVPKQQTHEYLLMIGDWYHRQGDELLDWYLSADSFGMEPVPDSILINGAGSFRCEDAVPARPLDCHSTKLSAIIRSIAGHTADIKLRIINTGVYSGYTIYIPGFEAEVLAVDGGNAVDSTASASTIGVLRPGERVDIMFRDGISSELSVHLDTESYKYTNPALTTTQRFPLSITSGAVVFDQIEQALDLDKLTSSAKPPPEEVDMTMVLYVVSEKLAHLDYVPHGTINRTWWQPQAFALKKQDREYWDEHQFAPHIEHDATKPRWVDLVVNNLDEEDHPFHLHGYDFYVMSRYSSTHNWGSYNPFATADPAGGSYSKSPLIKDTVAIPRRGYAVLRFKADNPGLWMFHCHVLWHLASGMAMSFDVS